MQENKIIPNRVNDENEAVACKNGHIHHYTELNKSDGFFRLFRCPNCNVRVSEYDVSKAQRRRNEIDKNKVKPK